MCELNCQTLLTFIKDGAQRTHPYSLHIDKICTFILRDWDIVLLYTLGEGNSSVD